MREIGEAASGGTTDHFGGDAVEREVKAVVGQRDVLFADVVKVLWT